MTFILRSIVLQLNLQLENSSDSPKRVFPASAEAEASADAQAEASAEAICFGSQPKLRYQTEA